jgi:hypothetical protein
MPRARRHEVDVVDADALFGDNTQLLGACQVVGPDRRHTDHHAVGILMPVAHARIVPTDNLGALRGEFDAGREKRIEHIDLHAPASRPRFVKARLPYRLSYP